MRSGLLLRIVLLTLSLVLLVGSYPVFADSSHARIIRLSLVQGDVRFTRSAPGQAAADQNAAWEPAELNLPIRQGYVLATGNGRAEVEFENGAMAFLNENTELEFYDLTLENGGRNTRLVLRQGTASFIVNPADEDYFSVTGGDFTAVAGPRANFRVDNSDSGSTVDVSKGRINVIHGDVATPLVKGQSLSMQAGNDAIDVGHLHEDDDFDRWVSGRVDTVVTATNAALQYTSSPYYSSGFADLYTYGSWYPISGYGNCWRPYGAGLGWSPFDNGSWLFDSFYGWGFIGYQPWGWLPYHFGSWIFDPGFGWLWVPGGFGYGGFVNWVPVTGRFVRSRTGLLGVVPLHPLDAKGKSPVNLAKGVMPLKGGVAGSSISAGTANEWKVVKHPSREALPDKSVHVGPPPARVTRAIVATKSNERAGAVSAASGSAITYDPREHRFVNSNPSPATSANQSETHKETGKSVLTEHGVNPGQNGSGTVSAGTAVRNATNPPPAAAARASVPPSSARSISPPPAPHASGGSGARGGYSGGEASRSVSPSHSSAPAPSSHPSSAPSGGGRPH
jgi:FecR protein